MDAAKRSELHFWLLGDLSQSTITASTWRYGSGCRTVLLSSQAKSLNLVMIVERDAFDLGVEVGRVRLIVFV